MPIVGVQNAISAFHLCWVSYGHLVAAYCCLNHQVEVVVAAVVVLSLHTFQVQATLRPGYWVGVGTPESTLCAGNGQ